MSFSATTKHDKIMEVIIRPDKETAIDLTAQILEKAVREKPKLVMCLATGRTMEKLYEKLSEKKT